MTSHIQAKIIKTEQENDVVVTLAFDIDTGGEPGQFLMVWLPGLEEKPYSIAGRFPLRISVAGVGPFSKKLAGMKAGEYVWLRGPYGRGFELIGQQILLIGGGYGFAPLRFLADEAKKKNISAVAICKAKSKSLLMKPASCKTILATSDGSEGIMGNVLDVMANLLKKEKFDSVYTCGPEKMMGEVMRLAKRFDVPECQLLAERHMKCGIGICGHCCMGEKLVCFDGPMFGYEILDNPEFEKISRDKCGRKVKV